MPTPTSAPVAERAFALLKNESTAEAGIKSKRLIAGLSEIDVEKILLET